MQTFSFCRTFKNTKIRKLCLSISVVVLEDVFGLEDVFEDRFVKSLALASTVLSLASALIGLGYYAVLGSRTPHFQKFNFATSKFNLIAFVIFFFFFLSNYVIKCSI